MRTRNLNAAALLALLAMSQSAASAPAGQDQSVSPPDMQKGAYAETISIVSVSGSAPPELRAAVRDKATNTSQMCYNPDPVDGRIPTIFEVHGGKDCRIASVERSGETARIQLACQDSETKGTMTLDGTFGPTSARFTSTVAVDFVKQKRSMSYTARVTWDRSSDRCSD